MPPTKIVKTLTPLGINKRLVFRTLSRYKETNGVPDRPEIGLASCSPNKRSCPLCARARLMWNPLWKQKIMAREMQIAPRTMSRILPNDLGLRAYKCYTRHLLITKLKEIRRVKVQKLLKSYESGAYHDILSRMRKLSILRRPLINKITACTRDHPSKPQRKCRVSSTDTIWLTWWSGCESTGDIVLLTSILVSRG